VLPVQVAPVVDAEPHLPSRLTGFAVGTAVEDFEVLELADVGVVGVDELVEVEVDVGTEVVILSVSVLFQSIDQCEKVGSDPLLHTNVYALLSVCHGVPLTAHRCRTLS